MYTHHKLDHEFPGGGTPTRSFVVCSVPRSGSSLLCELLTQTGLAGAPTEFFDQELMSRFSNAWGTETFDDYLAAMLFKKTSPNAVFGVKAHYHQLQTTFQHRDLSADLPNPHFIYIRRLDHLRQAISWVRADQTGLWASDHGPTSLEPQFDRERITDFLRWIEREEDCWEAFFQRETFSPFRIVYEEFVESIESTVEEVMAFLDIRLPAAFRFTPPTLERQADRLSEEWVRQYLA